MKNKRTFFVFALMTLFAVLISGFASAIESAEFDKEVIDRTDVLHDQGTVQISFNLNNTGESEISGIRLSVSKDSDRWKFVPATIDRLAPGNRVSITGILTIQKNTPAGTNSYEIKAMKDSDVLDSLTVNIIIKESSSLFIEKTQELTASQDGIIKVTNTGNTVLSNIQLSATGDLNVAFSSERLSSNNMLTLEAGNFEKVNVKGANLDILKFGSHDVKITAKSTEPIVSSNEITFTINKVFCKGGEAGGNLEIKNIDIDNEVGENDVWQILDNVKIEVEIENNGEDKIRDVFVELGLFDSDGKNLIRDLDFSNEGEEKIDLGDLDDGESETVEFEIKVPADLKKDGDFKLAVKAYSKDSGETKECVGSSEDLDKVFYQNIKIEREDEEDKFIAFDNIELTPGEAVCGDSVNLRFEAFNIGDENQKQVKISLKNTKLGIDMSKEIKDDMEEGDSKQIEFEFSVPEKATDGNYNLELNADYDYSNGRYRQSLDEATVVPLKIFGCEKEPVKEEKKVLIAASLDSEAKAGSEMIVKSIVTNLGSEEADFIMGASGYESWADLNSISERLFKLKAGESKEVKLNFNVNEEAKGKQSFTLEVLSGSKEEKREVEVNIEEKETPSTGIGFGENSLIWIIGAINVILIILIIIVAARISRR